MNPIGKNDIATAILQEHEKAIAFSQFLQLASEKAYEKVPARPLSHGALFRIHTSALVLHKAVRDSCFMGWAQVCGVLLRSLFECQLNSALIGNANHGIRAFCFFYHYQLARLRDSSIPKEERAILESEIEVGLTHLEKADAEAVRSLLAAKKLGGPYWYSHEYDSPRKAIKGISTHPAPLALHGILAGATHGGHVSTGLFLDRPDEANHDPKSNPKSATLAAIYSTRMLHEVCRIRVMHEIPKLRPEIDELVNDFVALPEVRAANPA